MATYRMEDGTVVKTENAKAHYPGESDHNGQNWIQRSTKDQWLYQDLYESRKGRYYIVHSSAWQGSQPYAEWVSPDRAAAWITTAASNIRIFYCRAMCTRDWWNSVITDAFA